MELIKRIRTVATSEGMEKLVAELRAGAAANARFAESGNVVSISSAKLSREQLSAANAFDATRKRVDEAYRNFTRYRTEVANVARAVEQGKTSQEEANRTLELAAIKYKQVATEQDNLIRLQDAYASRAKAYRESLDPAFAAQNRFNAAIHEAEDLYTAGAISADVYAAGVQRAARQLREAEVAIVQNAKAQAEQANARFATSIGVRDDFDATERAADIAAYGAALDTVRSKYDPLFAAQAAYKRDLAEVKAAVDAGAISEATYAKRLQERKAAFAETMRGMGRISAPERDFNSAFDAAAAENDRFNATRAESARRYDADFDAALVQNRVRDASDAAGRDIAGFADEMKRAREAIIPLEKAQNAYRASLKTINDEAKRGTITEKERVAAIQRTKGAFAEQVKYLQGAGLAAGAASKNFRLTGYEITNLSYQINDMATMLAAGSSPFQVLATQGGQIYQILSGTRGGVVAGLKNMGGLIAGLFTPLRLVAGGLAGLGVAAVASYASWMAAQKRLENSLQGLGRSTGATAADLERVSIAGANAATITISSARDMSAQFASTGKIGTGLYEDLIVASRNFARITSVEATEAAGKLAEAFADPAAGALELDKALNFLDQSTLDLIRSLTNANRRQEAQAVLLRNLKLSLPDAAKNVSLLARAWENVTNAVSNAGTKLGWAASQFIDGPSEDDLYNVAKKRLAGQTPETARFGYSAAQRAEDERRVREYETRTAADAARARAQQQEKDAISSARSSDPRYAELESITKQMTAAQAVIAKNRQSNAQFDEMWGGTSSTVQELETHLSGLKNRYDELANSQGMLKPITESMRKEMGLQLEVINATTQADRNRAQAALDEYRARAAGSNDAVVAATKENSLLQSNAEMNAQLTQAQRDRIRSAKEAVTVQQLEISLIGKTAGEAAVLRANYQAFVDLQREAAATGLPFDKARYEAIRKQNEALREQADLYGRMSLREQVGFDIDQLGRTRADQTVASTQRSMGLPVDLDSYEAGLIRTREHLYEIRDASSEAFTGFVSSLMQGASAGEALNSVLSRVADRLLNLASDQIFANLLGGGQGGGAGGFFGSILKGFGAGGSIFGAGTPATGGIYASGGFTGPGGKYEPAGVVHRGEYVFPKEAVDRLGVARLESLNRRAKGFAAGGYAGATAAAAALGPSVKVELHTLPGTTADVQPRRAADGSVSLAVIMRELKGELAKDYQSRGPLARVLEGGYHMTRRLG